MRRVLHIFVIIPFLLLAACTQKENDIPIPIVAFIDTVVPDFEQAELTCAVSGNFTVEQLSIEYSKDESLADAKNAKMSTSGKGFSIRIPQLEIQTTYYYRYLADNRISRIKDDKIRQFKTKDYIAPIVTTCSATDITATSATLAGTVGYTCGKAVTERGFLISKEQGSPERKVVSGDQFTLTIDNLDFGTKYSYQAYATSEIGTGTGELLEFVTLSGNPEMETKPASSIASYTAKLNGEITSDGGSPIKERGFYYSTAENPTIADKKVQCEGTTGEMSREITELTPATKYYTRVYAINGKGTHYGNVIEFTTEAVPVSSVTLNKTTLTLEKGKSETLIATVLPEDATDKTVTWSSSTPTVVSVDQSGKITALLGGSATITAKAGDKTATCAVSVIAYVESVSLNKTTLTLAKGSSETLVATVKPDDATDKTVTWTSSNTSIVSVDQNGKVAALKGGKATISAKAGEKTATCEVNVTAAVTSVTLNKTTLTLDKGKSETLTVTVLPEDATDKTVTWTSSNANVAYVDLNGKVTALLGGNATITAKAGDKTAMCTVMVNVSVTGITLSQTLISLDIDQIVTLTATVSPSDATDKNVTWSSSNPSIAMANDGVVVGIAEGNCIITAQAGDKTATCFVTVNKKGPEAIDLGLSVKWATFNVGASAPEEYGDYFAWGETEPYYTPGHSQDSPGYDWRDGKTGYNWPNYQWCNGSYNTLTRYCQSNRTDYWGGSGSPDDKTEFRDYDYVDDAARANWGGMWRMPTDAEWTELRNNCTWTWTGDYNGTGIAGRIIRSNKSGYTDRSIFIPAAGCRTGSIKDDVGSDGYYWSSSVNTDSPSYAQRASFSSSNVYRSYGHRCNGFSVRPVYSETINVSWITLDIVYLLLNEGESCQLTASIGPDYAIDKTVTWSSSNTSVVTVYNGNVTAIKEGTATITAMAGSQTATCYVTVKQITSCIPEAVDLGLSVKWATFNVGASSPEEYGDYYAWGETDPYYTPGHSQDSPGYDWRDGKTGYNWPNYQWCNGSYNTLTRYCQSNRTDYWGGSGSPDDKTKFRDYDYEDDAARAQRGGKWRTPTAVEWVELWENCTWIWTDNYNGIGVAGRLVMSNKSGFTDRSIFLPAAGHRTNTDLYYPGSKGNYWSSSLSTIIPYQAWSVVFTSDRVDRFSGSTRCDGYTIRPVLDE